MTDEQFTPLAERYMDTVFRVAYSYLRCRDNAPAPAANGVQIDRKRLAQMRQKRVALGHKPDDHEFEPQGYTMQFR